MIVCSICAANHLPQAMSLARSLKRTQPDTALALCLVERDRASLRDIHDQFDKIVLASELGIRDFELFIFRHNVYEACCVIKPRVLLWAMHTYPGEKYFIFMDPDMQSFSRFEEVESLLPANAIIVTPHYLHDEVTLPGTWPMVKTLACGTFNAGFLALRRDTESQEFLNWWSRKLEMFCFADGRFGLYVDQRWLDSALSFFDLSVLREPGYNVASWNINRREITRCPNSGEFVVCGKPLRCFHFSNIGPLSSNMDYEYFQKHFGKGTILCSLREEYIAGLSVADVGGLSRTPWSYGHFHSGEPIANEVRDLFRRGSVLNRLCPNPFAESNASLFWADGRVS